MSESSHFCVLLNEDELSVWQHCMAWKLPRSGFALTHLTAKKFSKFNPLKIAISERWEDWLLAEFILEEMPTKKSKSVKKGTSVPFFRVAKLYGFNDNHTELLKSRYTDFGGAFAVVPPPVRDAFFSWWQQSRLIDVKKDIEDGMTGLAEICEVSLCKETAGIVEPAALKIIVDNLNNSDNSREIDRSYHALLNYSRINEFSDNYILSAVCDLGIILRDEQRSENDADAVNKLSAMAKDRLHDTKPFEWHDVSKMLDSVAYAWPLLRLGNVVFLKWKFELESQCGRPDFQTMLNDIAQIRNAQIPDAELSWAVALFGAHIGFSAFADEYHLWKREKAVK